MKKLISAILALVMIMTVMPITAFAEEENSNSEDVISVNVDTVSNKFKITYDKTTKTLTVSGEGDLGKLDYTRKHFNFGNPLNWDTSQVFYAETLIVEDGIESIGDYLFMNFKHLKKAVFPDTLYTIGKASFLNCQNLEEIDGGDTLTVIRGGAFFHCTSLKSIKFPFLEFCDENTVNIFRYRDGETGDFEYSWLLDSEYSLGAFMYCTSLESVYAPNLAKIGDRTFYDCPKLKNLNGDNNFRFAETLGVSAFYNCKSLESISLPTIYELKSGKMNGENAHSQGTFENCTSLKSVNIPKVTTINENTFFNCTSLKTINGNNDLKKVTYLGAGAFAKCSSLEKISLPNVKSLLMSKWTENDLMNFPQLEKYCSNLTVSDSDYYRRVETFYYDFSLSYINYLGEKNYGTFEGCTKLKNISVPNVTTVDARAFYQCQNLKTISMPKAKTLGASAFYNCKSLTTVYLPNISTLPNTKWTDFNTKKSYYRGVFENCSKLKKLTTLSLDTVGIYSFKNCKLLEKVDLCCNLKSIGNNAFQNCTSLKSITIPKRVKTIGSSAFYNAKNLKKITIETTKLTTVSKNAFKKINSKATFNVPKKQLKKYKKLIKPTAPKAVKYKAI
jgi:hypothetical protein